MFDWEILVKKNIYNFNPIQLYEKAAFRQKDLKPIIKWRNYLKTGIKELCSSYNFEFTGIIITTLKLFISQNINVNAVILVGLVVKLHGNVDSMTELRVSKFFINKTYMILGSASHSIFVIKPRTIRWSGRCGVL